MDFLASPVHNCNFETFDDAFFDLPKEMDFELNGELRDNMVYSADEDDDLNNGMYGMWNAKHPWSINNNSASLYSSNLHLDFIGGDPESAIMVNPNVVIPNGFHLNGEESVNIEGKPKEEIKENALPNISVSSFSSAKIENSELLSDDSVNQIKNIKTKFSLLKEDNTSRENIRVNLSKNNVRVFKPTVVDSSSSTTIVYDNQLNRLKNGSPTAKTSNLRCGYYYRNEPFYPKPAFSYSCLIAMALKNSKHGCLPVAEIYNFMCNHFPYFKTAPNGWKNSVRHNLSLNKCFEKIEKPAGCTQRKGCLWALNPNKAAKLEDEVQKWTKKDATAIRRAMEYPEHLELLEKGELKSLYDAEQSIEDDDDDIDMNEDDTEGEELNTCDDDDIVDERLSENDDQESGKPANQIRQYPVSNATDTNDLPEFNIEVDGSIYEELIGTIENEELFTINGSSVNSINDGINHSSKKVHKFYLSMNGKSSKKDISQENEPEYDHYDINNLLRFENETKIALKKQPRFNKRLCSNGRIKQIKFKTWN